MNALDTILPHIPAFLMVFFRIGGIFVFAPVFASDIIPMRIKVFLSLALAFCIYPIVPTQVPLILTVPSLVAAIATEMLIGIIIGYGASIPLYALQLAGIMMGQQLGLGLAQVFNPDFNEETEVLSQFLYLTALTVFILLNGHHALLAALAHSFHAVPLGGYAPQSGVISFIVGLLGSMFELGLRVAAPLLCLIFLETIALGFVARTVPQLNILSIGFPLRILLGWCILLGISAMMFDSVAEFIRQTLATILHLFGV